MWQVFACWCPPCRGSGISFCSVCRLPQVPCCIRLTGAIPLQCLLISCPTFPWVLVVISGLQREYDLLSEFSCRCDNILWTYPHLLTFPANSTTSESALMYFICLSAGLRGCCNKSALAVVRTQCSQVLWFSSRRGVFRFARSGRVAISFCNVGSFPWTSAVPAWASCQQ